MRSCPARGAGRAGGVTGAVVNVTGSADFLARANLACLANYLERARVALGKWDEEPGERQQRAGRHHDNSGDGVEQPGVVIAPGDARTGADPAAGEEHSEPGSNREL